MFKQTLFEITTFILCFLALETFQTTNEVQISQLNVSQTDQLCDNHFKYISTYALRRQTDLSLAFSAMQKTTIVDKVVYKDEVYRTYTISDFIFTFTYMDGKQKVSINNSLVNVSGGILKISYNFTWQKKQLSSSIQGNGSGVVNTDPISYMKALNITLENNIFQWNFISADDIQISNSLTVSQISPYKEADYLVINQMFNTLKSGDPTVKTKLIPAINANFSAILKKVVHENNDTWKEPQKVYYTYSDYHGQYSIIYDSIIRQYNLNDKGLSLLLSQKIQSTNFTCGDKVPNTTTQKFGGLQQYISNTFIKQTIKNALLKGFFDVVLTQQFWQSPAFQFYMGDVHDVMPLTKNISSLETINGRCKAMNDDLFQVAKNKDKTYLVSMNFTCDFSILNNSQRLFRMNIVVKYEIQPILLTSSLNFVIKTISGIPTFIEQEKYPIKNIDLAQYMVDETLKMAIKSNVFGSGFKVLSRRNPTFIVNSKYLFLYDTATSEPTPIQIQQTTENSKNQIKNQQIIKKKKKKYTKKIKLES